MLHNKILSQKKKNKNKSTAITTNPNQQQQTKAILPVGSSSNLE
jgi:hypothetical protein